MEKVYMISEKVYHKHINAEVHMYGMLRQLGFLAGKVTDQEDLVTLQESALSFGDVAEEMIEELQIPARYLTYGDTEDLEYLKEKELTELENDPDIEPEEQAFIDKLISIFGERKPGDSV